MVQTNCEVEFRGLEVDLLLSVSYKISVDNVVEK